MKTNYGIRFLLMVIVFTSFSQKNSAQYYNFLDPYSFGLQLQLQQQQQQILQQMNQNMNDFYYNITPNYSYITKDGKTLTIEVQLSRTVAFSNVECRINHSGAESRKIDYRTFSGDVIVPVGGSDWVIQSGDVLTVYYDNGKNWSYTFGEGMSSADWSRFCQNKLNIAIEKYNYKTPTVVNQPTLQYTTPVPVNQNNNGNQTSNRQRASQIDAQITQLQRKMADAQSSLELYKGWENERPSISTSQMVQSARNLVNTYSQQISNLQMEKASLGY